MEMEELIEKIMDKQVFNGEIVLYFNLRDAEEAWKVEPLLHNFEDATAYDEERRRGPGNIDHPREILVNVFEHLRQ
jgi:hypothetical protein